MPTPSYHVECLSNRVIAHDVWEVVFQKPEGFTFKGGQFVLFDVPLHENLSDIQPRAYSIASAPNEEHLLFVFKYKEGGRASIWVKELLQPGMMVRMQGPFGLFTVPKDVPKDIVMICTGTGIAPFRSQILEAKKRGDTRRIDLLFGVRREEDLFWAEELTRMSQEHEQFFAHLTLSQPSPSWTGHVGRVQTVIPHVAPDIERRQVFICGGPEMVSDIKKTCLEQWHVPKEALHAEGYI